MICIITINKALQQSTISLIYSLAWLHVEPLEFSGFLGDKHTVTISQPRKEQRGVSFITEKKFFYFCTLGGTSKEPLAQWHIQLFNSTWKQWGQVHRSRSHHTGTANWSTTHHQFSVFPQNKESFMWKCSVLNKLFLLKYLICVLHAHTPDLLIKKKKKNTKFYHSMHI